MGYLFAFLLIQVFEPERFFGGGNLWDILSMGLLVIGCFHYSPLKFGKFHYIPVKNVKGFFYFFSFLLLMIISLWRTSSFLNSDLSVIKNTLSIVLLPLYLYCLYLYKARNSELFEERLFFVLIHALGIYCTINLLAFILNPTFGGGTSTMFTLLGINSTKVVFPLYPNSHSNLVGSTGGFLVVLCLGYIQNVKSLSQKDKRTLYVYLFSGIVVTIMGDSRGTVFGILFTVLSLYFFIKIKKYKLLKYSVLLVPVSHVLFIFTLQFAANSAVGSEIARGKNDLATGNSRKFIYMAANRELADFKPLHMVGYGEYGIYGAGLTKYYMSNFGYTSKESRLISSVAHNTSLQAIFDIGYIGLIIYLLLLFTFFSQSQTLFEKGYLHFMLATYFLLYLIITGVSETRFGNYSPFQNFLFIIVAFIAINSYNNYLVKQTTKKELGW